MKTSLIKRIENFDFPHDNPILSCIEEAVSNSIQSIILSGKKMGHINIQIEQTRDLSNEKDSESETSAKLFNKLFNEHFYVESITIEDNGIGFNDTNFSMFSTLDTTDKVQFGCKGIGRLLYLKVADEVEITSTYKDNGQTYKRKFKFNREWDNIDDFTNYQDFKSESIESEVESTKLTFIPIKAEYREETLYLDALKQHLITYFFSLLLKMNAKNKQLTFSFCIITDGESQKEEFNIIDIINEMHIEQVQVDNVTIYHCKHKNKPKHKVNNNKIYYCGGFRVVETIPVPNFTKKTFFDKEKREYYYSGYVISQDLDKCVESNRFGWKKDKNSKKTVNRIKENVEKAIKEYLSEILKDLENDKEKRIKEVLKQHPIYDYLYESIHKHTDLDDDEKTIESNIYKLHVEERNRRRNNLSIAIKNTNEFDQIYSGQLASIKESAMVDLAEYFNYRKNILDTIDKMIERGLHSKKSYETIVHELIYPQRTSNVPADMHNLWFLDEKYVAYRDVYSDEKMKKILSEKFPNHDLDNELHINKEPDLFMFFTPLGFDPENKKEKYNTVAIELKGIDRDYKEKLAGLDQLNERIEIINQIDQINESWYYLITEFDDPFTHALTRHRGFLKLFSSSGTYYNYNQYLKAHIYILSYSGLVKDSKMRHDLFFKILGL